MLLNQKVKERIRATGIKQRFLADRLGVHEVTLTNMLAGRKSVPDDLLDRIAYELHLTPDEIVQTEEAVA